MATVIPTERSKRLQEVIALGQRLVEELKLIERIDTLRGCSKSLIARVPYRTAVWNSRNDRRGSFKHALSKWMAHYIAELMLEAEHAPEADARRSA